MTGAEAISLIENLSSGLTPHSADNRDAADNLTKARRLLEASGNPHRRLRFIHVCGSNGKGSVCAMLDAILKEAGYRTGLFTSPHVEDFCERIRVGGEMISESRLAELTERLMPLALAMDDPPGYFCFLTVLALIIFAEEGCDPVILETGIGGLHDSTNVIDAPEEVIVTKIGLEHTAVLGSTLEEIAREKAGVIKPGCACIALDSDPSVTSILRQTCEQKNVPLTLTEPSPDLPDPGQNEPGIPLFQTVVRHGETYDLALTGTFQRDNAALVLEAVSELRNRGFTVSEEALRQGLLHVRWPARFEVLRREPPVILDGGHNPQCAGALMQSLQAYLPGRKVIFVLGMMKDKNAGETIRILAPAAEQILCVSPDRDRGLDADELARLAAAEGIPSKAYENVGVAIDRALECCGHHPVVIFGSLYLSGIAENRLRNIADSSC